MITQPQQASEIETTPADLLTVLTSVDGHYATKVIEQTGDGIVIRPYDNATWFSVRELPIDDMDHLAAELTRMTGKPASFVIRGEPIDGINRQRTRRLVHDGRDGSKPTFAPKPRRWLMVDFDSVEAPVGLDPTDGEFAALWLRGLLPSAFDQASFWWSFTSGAVFKPGLRMRMAFWLDQPLSQDELDRWLDDTPCDKSLFRPVQPNYVAFPIFKGGHDPVVQRCGYVRDVYECVDTSTVPPPPPAPQSVMPAPYMLARTTETKHSAMDVLEDVCARIEATKENSKNPWGHNGRHSAVFCGALRISWFVMKGMLRQSFVEDALIGAGLNIGIRDRKEILRTIRNGFREGGV